MPHSYFDSPNKIAFAALVSLVFGAGTMWLSLHGVAFVKEGLSIAEYVNVPPVAAIGALSADEPLSVQKITLMIGGDVMMDRQIRRVAEEAGYDSLFSRIAPILTRADIAVLNLEGPITANKSKTLLDNDVTSKELIFTFDPQTSLTLANVGVDVVSLANNHTDNFGVAGYEETKHRLEAANIGWFGSPWNKSGTVNRTCIKEVCLAFVGYHEFQKGKEKVIGDIKKHATSSDLVIVMPHWGNEYATTSSPRQRTAAREFVAAGGDIIVGAHPHVVQEAEWLGDAPVFYSLGNFLFDQYFSENTMNGVLLEFEIEKNDSGTRISKIIQHNVSTAGKNGVDLISSETIYSL